MDFSHVTSPKVGTDFPEGPMRQLPNEHDHSDSHSPLDVGAATQPKVLSISELTKDIKGLLEKKFDLVWIQGEISNFKPHSSGHFYFSLKDKKAQINAVMFRGFNQQLKFKPVDGLEVMVRGRITVYEPRGNYQIFCEIMHPLGAGALQLAFEQLKRKLAAEGLFEVSRKRPLPTLPRHLALITSPTGAAIRDMLNVLRRRFRGLRITLIPAVVQGDQAPLSLVRALSYIPILDHVDVVIIGRGGGSIEDLWAFNDEKLARAIAGCPVPIVSAVGHEVDFTITDFVADLRAPTPSAAAELVVRSASELTERLYDRLRQVVYFIRQHLQRERRALESVNKRLTDPKRKLQDFSLRCDELSQRLCLALSQNIGQRRLKVSLLTQKIGSPHERLHLCQRQVQYLTTQLQSGWGKMFERRQSALQRFMAMLDSLSPLRVVERGFSIVTLAGQVVRSATQLKKQDKIHVQLGRGQVHAEVVEVFTEKEE